MKPFDLQPTPENILSTFERNLIGRNADIQRFLELLDSLESGSSIALDAHWGAGKTFFVKQTKMILDAFNDHVTSDYEQENFRIKSAWNSINNHASPYIQPQVSVYYDAWLNDNDEDPILSLVYTILQSVSTDFEFKRGPECATVAAGIIETLTGKNFTTLLESLRSTDPLASLRDKKDIHSQVEQFLESLLSEQGNRLIVFVDELDRCKPTFAVRLLERIKHYFSNDRITFVFSVNISQLQHTIKQYYGSGFDACKYLDRFFDLRITLPPANTTKFYKEIGLDHGSWIYESICKTVIEAYDFSLRDIARFYRIARTAAYKSTHNNRCYPVFGEEKAIHFCLVCFVPIMIGLKIHDHSRFEAFVHGEDPTPLHKIIRNPDMATWLCSNLLSSDETYEPVGSDEKLKVVSFKDKLDQVYEALFIHRYTSIAYEKQVGQLSFRAETKIALLKACSMLSDSADYDI